MTTRDFAATFQKEPIVCGEDFAPLVLKSYNPCMPSGLFYLNSLDRSVSYIRGVWLVFLLPCFIEMYVLSANSVD